MAMDQHTLSLNAKVKIRITGLHLPDAPKGFVQGSTAIHDTTLGSALFNEALPADYPWVSGVADKGLISSLVNDLAERYPKVAVAETLDRVKDAGFYWATRSGVTVALSDVLTPKGKKAIIAKYEKLAAKIQTQFEKGLISDVERRR